MEKEIIWTKQAENDFWEIVTYLKECWPPEVLDSFEQALALKTQLLQKQPYIGFKKQKAYTISKDLRYKILCHRLLCKETRTCHFKSITCKNEASLIIAAVDRETLT